jgi:hypothetical protein
MNGISQLISIEDYAAERGRTPADVQQIRHAAKEKKEAKSTDEAKKKETK